MRADMSGMPGGGRRRDRFAPLTAMTDALAAASDAEHLLATVMESATRRLDADRSTLFLIDRARGELWSKIAQRLEITEIRMPLDRGIAGHVAATGATLNLPDVYADPRFNPEVDQLTGYRTRALLCMAVRNPHGQTVGVIQVINKHDGVFTPADEQALAGLCAQAAILIDALTLETPPATGGRP